LYHDICQCTNKQIQNTHTRLDPMESDVRMRHEAIRLESGTKYAANICKFDRRDGNRFVITFIDTYILTQIYHT
jgi:hypothetical protein